jgi:hypothetical protein
MKTTKAHCLAGLLMLSALVASHAYTQQQTPPPEPLPLAHLQLFRQ